MRMTLSMQCNQRQALACPVCGTVQEHGRDLVELRCMTCIKFPPGEASPEDAYCITLPEDAPRTRNRRCGRCRMPGHNRRTCVSPAATDPLPAWRSAKETK